MTTQAEQITLLFPLEPPHFVPGKFEYIIEDSTRDMLVNAWQAITLTESLNFVSQHIDHFMTSNHPKIFIISNKMCELGYNGHSGASFGWTMRQMQFIAKYGEKSFKEMYEKEKKD